MNFVLRRFSFYLTAFFVAITFNFFLPRIMPGSPVDALFAAAGGKMDMAQMDAVKEMYGFVDGSLFEQYLAYIKSVFTLDLGPSVLMFPTEVTKVIGMSLPWTMFLALGSLIVALIIGVSIGTYASYRREGLFGQIVPPVLAFISNFPYVVTALLLFYIFALQLEMFPLGYTYDPMITPGFTWEFISSVATHAVLPMGSMILVGIATWVFNMRNAMINVLGEDYVTMAEAKGLSSFRVMYRYAGRNAILPVATAIAMAIGFSFAGSILTEVVFNYQGLGNILLKGITARDYPLIQAILLILVTAVLTANFIADLLYVWLDPRIDD
ncbi:ABC transporter permease [Vibrio breoganii]|uniref:ABC transporter permease n=1 Tax=Vibrio breoganii TaxID=553239 RepID=UPI00031022AB|nr:ABC transporter permease [Vibrio breoganii]MDN3714503.1 ABC transporter permease [Vibrio breoganii]OCH77536.1 peptide ABC transporter permease [Vibrio breoganii]OED98806.1 peptide ABC transporter permease [Vibrio breoganii ZF-55]OED99277.1 peptide ABC transporter permease [Vibrio breoganii ZF-29]PMG05412.1 peptide ABC transporter permease [Vibrio breoganii]